MFFLQKFALGILNNTAHEIVDLGSEPITSFCVLLIEVVDQTGTHFQGVFLDTRLMSVDSSDGLENRHRQEFLRRGQLSFLFILMLGAFGFKLLDGFYKSLF